MTSRSGPLGRIEASKLFSFGNVTPPPQYVLMEHLTKEADWGHRPYRKGPRDSAWE